MIVSRTLRSNSHRVTVVVCYVHRAVTARHHLVALLQVPRLLQRGLVLALLGEGLAHGAPVVADDVELREAEADHGDVLQRVDQVADDESELDHGGETHDDEGNVDAEHRHDDAHRRADRRTLVLDVHGLRRNVPAVAN